MPTESYEEAVRIAPQNYDVLNTYAVFLCRQGGYDEAIKYFDRAIKVRENDDVEITLTNAGTCLIQKPDPVKAERYFREALDHKSDLRRRAVPTLSFKAARRESILLHAHLCSVILASNMPSAEVLYLGMQIEEQLGDERARTDYSNRILREFPESPQARKVLESS